MFGLVSRKDWELLANAQESMHKCLCEFRARIEKLEAANNCRDGKHEWVEYPNIVTTTSMICTTFTNKGTYTACKHCAIKKDEWEKQLIDTDLPTLKKRMCGEKPQPKRKKRKK